MQKVVILDCTKLVVTSLLLIKMHQQLQEFDFSKFNKTAREYVPIFQIRDLKSDYRYPIEKARLARTQWGVRAVLKVYDIIDGERSSSFEIYLPEKFSSILNLNTLESFNNGRYYLKCKHQDDQPSLILLEK